MILIIHLDYTYFQVGWVMGVYLAIMSILCQGTIIRNPLHELLEQRNKGQKRTLTVITALVQAVLNNPE